MCAEYPCCPLPREHNPLKSLPLSLPAAVATARRIPDFIFLFLGRFFNFMIQSSYSARLSANPTRVKNEINAFDL